MSNIKKSIVVCLLTAVLLVSMAGMASALSQEWYLTDFPESPSVSGAKYRMEKDSGTGEDVAAFSGSKVWIAATSGGANQPAENTVDMSGIWTGKLKGVDGGDTTTLYIGILNPDTGTFTSKGSQEFALTATPAVYDISIATTGFTIPAGDYLAVKISSPVTVTIYTTGDPNSDTYVTSPQTDPDYPVPELPTIILTSAGLLALLGYVGYRRRDNK